MNLLIDHGDVDSLSFTSSEYEKRDPIDTDSLSAVSLSSSINSEVNSLISTHHEPVHHRMTDEKIIRDTSIVGRKGDRLKGESLTFILGNQTQVQPQDKWSVSSLSDCGDNDDTSPLHSSVSPSTLSCTSSIFLDVQNPTVLSSDLSSSCGDEYVGDADDELDFNYDNDPDWDIPFFETKNEDAIRRRVLIHRAPSGIVTSHGDVGSLSESDDMSRSSISSLPSTSSRHSSRLSSPQSSLCKSSFPASSIKLSDVESDSWGCTNDRAIENIPVLIKLEPATDELLMPQVWHKNEYVQAKPLHDHGSSQKQQLKKPIARTARLVDKKSKTFMSTIEHQRKQEIVTELLDQHEQYMTFSTLEAIFLRYWTMREQIILDIGCGTSHVSTELVYRGYNHLYGVDLNTSAIAYQQARSISFSHYVCYKVMDVTIQLEFPDQYVKYVLTKGTMDAIAANDRGNEYPHRLITAVSEIARCLAIGGIWIDVTCCSPPSNDVWLSDDEEEQDKRVERPWWEWRILKQMILQQFTFVNEYRAGQQYRNRGQVTRPYTIRIWRRLESFSQRFERVYTEWMRKKSLEFAYNAHMRCHTARLQHLKDDKVLIRERRQMIIEDVEARKIQLQIAFAESANLRQQRLEAFYKRLIVENHELMKGEDAYSMAIRENEALVIAIVQSILNDITESSINVANKTVMITTPITMDAAGSVEKSTYDIYTWMRDVIFQSLFDKATSTYKPVRRLRTKNTKPVSDPNTTNVVATWDPGSQEVLRIDINRWIRDVIIQSLIDKANVGYPKTNNSVTREKTTKNFVQVVDDDLAVTKIVVSDLVNGVVNLCESCQSGNRTTVSHQALVTAFNNDTTIICLTPHSEISTLVMNKDNNIINYPSMAPISIDADCVMCMERLLKQVESMK